MCKIKPTLSTEMKEKWHHRDTTLLRTIKGQNRGERKPR